MLSTSRATRREATAGGDSSARALPKGQQTKVAIIDAALRIAAQVGLQGLSIGALAEVMGMSKSGVFAHFGSREELQISVVSEYFNRFEREVFYPALDEPRGLPRLRAMFANWMHHTSIDLEAGSIFISGAVEFDDQPGPVRDALVQSVGSWLDAMGRAIRQAREEGHLVSNTDERQVAFEIHALILGLHYEARFLHMPGAVERTKRGFESVIARYSPRS